jgi:hypothetical protein
MLEKIAYALARGAVRAYLDVMAEGRKAVDEAPNDDDLAFADEFGGAIDRVRSEDDVSTERISAPSNSATG